MVDAFGGTDVTATLSIAGELASLDEYWASELCFKMVGWRSLELHRLSDVQASSPLLYMSMPPSPPRWC